MEDKLCKYCAMMIPAEAKICPSCRKKQTSTLLITYIAGFFLFIFLIAIISEKITYRENKDSDLKVRSNIPSQPTRGHQSVKIAPPSIPSQPKHDPKVYNEAPPSIPSQPTHGRKVYKLAPPSILAQLENGDLMPSSILARLTDSDSPPKVAQTPIESLTTVSVYDLARAYDQNTIAADQRFKGKRFKVTGTVVDINTDFFGRPYLVLNGGVNQFMNPHFEFDKGQENILANIKKGDRVVLVCKGVGDIAKTPMSDSCILLE